MIPDVEPEKVRYETEIPSVERMLGSCALQFALLGAVQIAREMMEILLENGASLGNWVMPTPLTFACQASDQWPEGWPLERTSPSEEDYQTERNASWDGLPTEYRNSDEDQAVLDACLNAEDDQFADAETGWSAMKKGQRLIRALELSVTFHGIKPDSIASADDDRATKKTKGMDGEALTHDEVGRRFRLSDLDTQSAEILNKIVNRLHANQQIAYLGEAKRLWPFWIRGLLADAIGINKEDVESKGQALLQAFKTRYEHGHAPSPLAGKSIKELLEIGNKNTLEYLEREEGDMGPVPETLFKQPATDEEIEELEERLETVLPDDYKEFLKISNGFGGEGENGIFNGYFPDPALYDISQVVWNEEEYFQLPVDLLELGREYEELIDMENKQSRPDGDFDWDTAFPLFDRVLEVGVRDIDNLWLVHPQLVEKAKEQYHSMYRNANERQKKVIVRAMESFAGSKEAFESMHWCFAKWSSGGSATMVFSNSFQRYLETVAVESMEEK